MRRLVDKENQIIDLRTSLASQQANSGVATGELARQAGRAEKLQLQVEKLASRNQELKRKLVKAEEELARVGVQKEGAMSF